MRVPQYGLGGQTHKSIQIPSVDPMMPSRRSMGGQLSGLNPLEHGIARHGTERRRLPCGQKLHIVGFSGIIHFIRFITLSAMPKSTTKLYFLRRAAQKITNRRIFTDLDGS
jgi:hypothetical protein